MGLAFISQEDSTDVGSPDDLTDACMDGLVPGFCEPSGSTRTSQRHPVEGPPEKKRSGEFCLMHPNSVRRVP